MDTRTFSSTVLVTVRFFDEVAADRLRARGIRVLRGGVAFDAIDSEITPAMEADLREAQAWIIGAAPVTAEILRRFPNLEIVARRGVGFDSVDVEAIKHQGRVLTNTPGGNEPAVADHTVALMLNVGKRLSEANLRLRGSEWRAIVGVELSGKTVGLIGFGRIGRQVARRLTGFGCEILVFDPLLSEHVAEEAGVSRCELTDLLSRSDFLSLHAPLIPSTRQIIGRETFGVMKPGAILVNTARGELIDEAALFEALTSGRLAGAGLDVFSSEQNSSARATSEALIALPNVVATPHTAGSTQESLQRANNLAVECVLAVLEGGSIPTQCIVADGRAVASTAASA